MYWLSDAILLHSCAGLFQDDFITGIHIKDTQQKLLELDSDFDACLNVALADETAVHES